MMTRRDILSVFAAVAAVGLPIGGFMESVLASPRDAKKRLSELTGGIKPKKARVAIILPKVTDQGDFVPLRVAVESPMSEEDHVKAIHIVAERNPTPMVASFHLSRAIGKAQVSTRIRLVKTQVVVAVAEMGDGSVYLGKARCKISTGAGGCG